MASIYDFGSNFQKYRNKQRLAGGTVDPAVVGSLAEADLNARYADQRSRRSQEIQQDSINKNYELAKNNQAINTYLANRQREDQKQAGLYSALASLPTIALTGYKMGKEAGLWGENKPSALEEAQTNYLNYLMGQNRPSLYDYSPNSVNVSYPSDFGGYSYNPSPTVDSLGNDISMALGDQVGDASQSDMSWLDIFKDWFF
jgi:hypothetical protein